MKNKKIFSQSPLESKLIPTSVVGIILRGIDSFWGNSIPPGMGIGKTIAQNQTPTIVMDHFHSHSKFEVLQTKHALKLVSRHFLCFSLCTSYYISFGEKTEPSKLHSLLHGLFVAHSNGGIFMCACIVPYIIKFCFFISSSIQVTYRTQANIPGPPLRTLPLHAKKHSWSSHTVHNYPLNIQATVRNFFICVHRTFRTISKTITSYFSCTRISGC